MTARSTTQQPLERVSKKTYQKPELINLNHTQPQNGTGDGADGSARNTTS